MYGFSPSGQYLNFMSNHPNHVKLDMIQRLFKNVESIFSNENDKTDKEHKINDF